MEYAFLTDGHRVIEFVQVTSQAELDKLNANVSETAGPDFKWVLQSLKPQHPDGAKLAPIPIINHAHYDGSARPGTIFKKGENWIADDDDFATFVINQEEPRHKCKILVFGDEYLRDLIINCLNELHTREEKPADDSANQLG